MLVNEAMTPWVVSVRPTTGLKEAARLMVRWAISGLPVVDSDNRVVGIVTEADILDQVDRPDRRAFGPDDAELDGELVGEVMTTPVITVAAQRSLAEAAHLMRVGRVKRLPVVDGEGRLVGIVSRADVVASFVRPDADIESEIRSRIAERILSLPEDAVSVEVKEGVVRLEGRVEARTDALVLERLAGRVDGVIKVESLLRWDVDDTAIPRDVLRGPWGVIPR